MCVPISLYHNKIEICTVFNYKLCYISMLQKPFFIDSCTDSFFGKHTSVKQRHQESNFLTLFLNSGYQDRNSSIWNLSVQLYYWKWSVLHENKIVDMIRCSKMGTNQLNLTDDSYFVYLAVRVVDSLRDSISVVLIEIKYAKDNRTSWFIQTIYETVTSPMEM